MGVDDDDDVGDVDVNFDSSVSISTLYLLYCCLTNRKRRQKSVGAASSMST